MSSSCTIVLLGEQADRLHKQTGYLNQATAFCNQMAGEMVVAGDAFQAEDTFTASRLS